MPSLVLRISYAVAVLGTGLMLTLGCSKTGIQSSVNRGAVGGSVRDSYTDRPLAGAVITVGDTSVTTGQDGNYEVFNIPRGLLPIAVHREGYENYEDSILISTKTEFHALLDSIGRFAHVHGRVFVGPTEIVMPGVRVSVGPRVTTSDSLGFYRVDSLAAGVYQVCGLQFNNETCRKPAWLEGDNTVDIRMEDTRISGRVHHVIDGPVKGALVDLSGIVTTTDETGDYSLEHVPQGQHTFRISHPEYLPVENAVFLDHKAADLDVRLQRRMVDTLPVEADAVVMWNNFDGCPACPAWGNADDNFGLGAELLLSHYLMPDPSAPGDAWQGVARAIMRLPVKPQHIPDDEFQDARLQFNLINPPPDDALITVRRAQGDQSWNETSMTWQEMPMMQHVPLAVYAPDDLAPIRLDVTSFYSETPSPASLILQTDESGTTAEPRTIRLHSRQSAAEDKRPVVFFEYIR